MLGTLRDSFIGNVSRWPNRTAIIESERAYTYADLDAAVNQCANLLIDIGVRKGDAVGLLLNNCPEFAIGFLACQKLGAVSSGLNFRLSAGALGYIVQQETLKAVSFNSLYSGMVPELMRSAGFCRFI